MYCHSETEWQAWANNPEIFLRGREAKLPPLDFIPAMQRRRLSQTAKLMFAALHGLQPPAQTPLIFAAHDGETNRSFSLWLQLLQEGNMSPMSFGLAVHNALAGAWSLFTGCEAEMNAITAHDAVLEMALMEAVMLLNDGAEAVNVAVVEDPLLHEYAVHPAVRAPFVYALALTVERGADYQLSYVGKGYEHPARRYWGALDFIAQQAKGAKSWRQDYAGGVWTWRTP